MQSTIHTSGVNTRFVPRSVRNATVATYDTTDEDRRKEMEQSLLYDNTDKLSEFGGKRFLGLTPKGKEVFAKYVVNRDDLSMTVLFTHSPSILLKEGSLLANDHYSWGLHEQMNKTGLFMVRKLKKSRPQEVTIQTLRWIKRLQLLTEVKYFKAFNKNKVTYNFVRSVGSMIHHGFGEGNTKPDLSSIAEVWKWPKNGPYFNPEEAWSYPDEL
jgi:hypothetical protein